jgi:MFS transporter, FHS family, Na+ dependent glucose transporter 1
LENALKKTIGYYLAFIALGISTALLGPTLPRLAEQTHSTIGQAGILFPASSLGYLAGVLLSGWLLDHLAGHKVMAVALFGMILSMLLLPSMPWLGMVALMIALIGAFGSTVDVGSNTLIVWVHRSAVAPYMNGLHFFFGTGAALMPVLYAFIYQRTNNFSISISILAALMLPGAIYLLLQQSPKAPESAQTGTTAPFNTGLVLLAAVCFFAYVGMEIGFGGWLFTYAQAKGLANESTAAVLTSAYWGMITLGRLLGVLLAVRFSPRTLLLSDFAVCLVGAAMVVFLPGSTALLTISTILLGLGNATIFPSTINLLEQRMAITARVTSMIFVGVSLGGMFLPWLMGQLFEKVGPDAAIVAILVDTVVTVVLYLVLIFGKQDKKVVALA